MKKKKNNIIRKTIIINHCVVKKTSRFVTHCTTYHFYSKNFNVSTSRGNLIQTA